MPLRSALLAVSLTLVLAACATPTVQPTGQVMTTPEILPDHIRTADDALLPLSVWRPAGEARAIVLGLHGFNDYRRAFEETGEFLAVRGYALYAYDQRGFGATAQAGRWFGRANGGGPVQCGRSSAPATPRPAPVRHRRKLRDDPMVIKATRVDAIRGLSELMEQAQAIAPAPGRPTLILYGHRDQLIRIPAFCRWLAGLREAPGQRLAVYVDGWHMLTRDLGGKVVLSDIATWLADPAPHSRAEVPGQWPECCGELN